MHMFHECEFSVFLFFFFSPVFNFPDNYFERKQKEKNPVSDCSGLTCVRK